MRLLFKQRFFSWFDSYDIYDEAGNTAYVVKGELSWGHRLVIYDAFEREVGIVEEKIFTFLPKFKIHKNGQLLGCLRKELSLFIPHYNLDYNGWHIDGSFMEWDYRVIDRGGNEIASISKQIFNFTDTYALDIVNPEDALDVLMFVLAIDAEKCSRN